MFKKLSSLTVIICFFLTSLGPLPKAHADYILDLPAPGTMVNLSPAYEPVMIKGLTVHKDNPLLFDFIVDVGQDHMTGGPLKKEGEKLIKYFLASLAIPDKDVWVNLSPYEKNRMIPEALGQTDMGRDLLEQDYILKQITASLIYPEKQLGKEFWNRVYAKAQEQYGTTQIPVNTFNKVWIMADRAEVFEHNQTAFVVDSHLKVMLEEDYLALSRHSEGEHSTTEESKGVLRSFANAQDDKTHSIASQIVKQIILPELEREVNTGKNFANLRQIFHSVILSSWYKRNLKEALLDQVYADKSKVKGINLNDPTVKEQIYEQYLKAYKKGVFNYIKEDINTANGDTMPRKYFSGGINEAMAANPTMTTDPATLAESMDGNSMVDFATLASTETTSSSAMTAVTVNYENRVWDIAIGENEIHSDDDFDLKNKLEKVLGEGLQINIAGNRLLFLEPGTQVGKSSAWAEATDPVALQSAIEKILAKRAPTEVRKKALIEQLPSIEGNINRVLSFISIEPRSINRKEFTRMSVTFEEPTSYEWQTEADLSKGEGGTGVLFVKRLSKVLETPAETYNLVFKINPRVADRKAILDAVRGQFGIFAKEINLDANKGWQALEASAAMTAAVKFSYESPNVDVQGSYGAGTSIMFNVPYKQSVRWRGKEVVIKFVSLGSGRPEARSSGEIKDNKYKIVSIDGQPIENGKELNVDLRFASSSDVKIFWRIDEESLTKALNEAMTAAPMSAMKQEDTKWLNDQFKKIPSKWHFNVTFFEDLKGENNQGFQATGGVIGSANPTVSVIIGSKLNIPAFVQTLGEYTSKENKNVRKVWKQVSKSIRRKFSQENKNAAMTTVIPTDGEHRFKAVAGDEIEIKQKALGVSLKLQFYEGKVIVWDNNGFQLTPDEDNPNRTTLLIKEGESLSQPFLLKDSHQLIFTLEELGTAYYKISNVQKDSGSLEIQEIAPDGRHKFESAKTAEQHANKPMIGQDTTRGGIDLNTSNGMQWKISKDGQGIEMNVDPAMIARIQREGISSLSLVIIKITPVTSIWPLVGLQAPAAEEHLAQV